MSHLLYQLLGIQVGFVSGFGFSSTCLLCQGFHLLPRFTFCGVIRWLLWAVLSKVPFLLATEALSFFTKVLLFYFAGVPSLGIFGASGVYIHRDCVVIPGVLEGLLGHSLPFALAGADKGVVPFTKSFSEDA